MSAGDSGGGGGTTMAPMMTTEHGDTTSQHQHQHHHRQPAFSGHAPPATAKMPGCVWTNEAVTLLLSLYLREQQLPRPQKQKKKDVWRGICAELWRRGLLCSWQECDKKYRNLKQTFVRNLKQAGKKECRWMFFPLMLEINRHEPFVGDVMLMAAATATAENGATEMAQQHQQLLQQQQNQQQNQQHEPPVEMMTNERVLENVCDDGDDDGDEHDDEVTADEYQSLAEAPVDGAPYTPAQSPTSAMNLSQRAHNPLPPPPTPVPPSIVDYQHPNQHTSSVAAQPPKKRRRANNQSYDFPFAASAEPMRQAIKVEPLAPAHLPSTTNPVQTVCKQSGSPLPLLQTPAPFLSHEPPATFDQQLVPLDIRLLQAAMPFVTHNQFGPSGQQLQQQLQQTIKQSLQSTPLTVIKTVPISPSTMHSDNDEADDDNGGDDDDDDDDAPVDNGGANEGPNRHPHIGNGHVDDDETRSMPGDHRLNDHVNNNHTVENNNVAPESSDQATMPPKWFHTFMAEFRRHEQRKLQQIAELCAEVRRTNDIEQQRNHILSEKNDILRHMNAYMVNK